MYVVGPQDGQCASVRSLAAPPTFEKVPDDDGTEHDNNEGGNNPGNDRPRIFTRSGGGARHLF